jgi:hypothetical protein
MDTSEQLSGKSGGHTLNNKKSDAEEIEWLRLRVKVLEERLKPFAEYASAVSDGWQDDTGTGLLFVQPDGSMQHKPRVNLGDCRKAREVLK